VSTSFVIIKSNKEWTYDDVRVLMRFWDVLRYKLKVVDIKSSPTIHGSARKPTQLVSYLHWPKKGKHGH
jgi:hypothetical protein